MLDLACGTGEVSRALLGLGAEVTGIDFSEAMLGRARAKHAGQPWHGRLADAETLGGLPDASFDGAVTRHLVWTLTQPGTAFAAWLRVLKPGARLLVVDGDWVRDGLRGRLMRRAAALLGGAPVAAPADAAVHREILARVPYHDGLTRDRLIGDLVRAGFTDPRPHGVGAVYLARPAWRDGCRAAAAAGANALRGIGAQARRGVGPRGGQPGCPTSAPALRAR